MDVARKVQELLSTSRFRCYRTKDVAGVELGGALKNVLAIACGISDGLNCGSNGRAALITRGRSISSFSSISIVFDRIKRNYSSCRSKRCQSIDDGRTRWYGRFSFDVHRYRSYQFSGFRNGLRGFKSKPNGWSSNWSGRETRRHSKIHESRCRRCFNIQGSFFISKETGHRMSYHRRNLQSHSS